MTEDAFWTQLEGLTCRELARVEVARALGLWCDGFVAERHAMDAELPLISGHAWGADHRTQVRWPFTLILRRAWPTRADIPWATLLPAPGAAGWLDVDVELRRLTLRP